MHNKSDQAEPDRARGDQGLRLQRVLAQAGFGSRRACELLIEQGRVEVDGKLVREQGVRVDPQRSVIRVDGLRVTTSTELIYLAVNKPRGMLSTMRDERGRPSIGDLVADRADRLYHVGRLDADSEGLLLVMNDGDLAHRLMHPSFEVSKTYLAEIIGPVARDVGRRLRSGIDLDDGLARADGFTLVQSSGNRVLVELTLHEGRKHVVRRMLAEVGHPVQRLVRTSIGPIELGSLKAGRTRHLTQHEVGRLHKTVGL